MKAILVFFLALCASYAVVFGLSGTYERMLFWYAYQMDPGNNIAPGCHRHFNRRCAFAEFMDYIDEHKRIPEGQIKQRLHGQNPATADTGADVLAQNRVIDFYGISYVGPNVHRTSDLFKYVTKSIGLWSYDADEAVYEQSKVDPNITCCCIEEGKEQPIIRDGLVPENDAEVLPNGQRVWSCDLKTAQDNIRAAGYPDFKVKPYFGEWEEKENGKPNGLARNIGAIKEGSRLMNPAACG